MKALAGLLPMDRTFKKLASGPIATYGFCLWYFGSSKTKHTIKTLINMQQQAVIWIIGAFCTSPTRGMEALAGLLLVDRTLKKL
jgi:hypothetical protein